MGVFNDAGRSGIEYGGRDEWKGYLRLRREVDESCALMGYYAASSGNSLPTFRDNLSVPFSSVKDTKSR